MAIETVPYAGWEHCVRLGNGRIEAVVTTDVGPRIIRFGAVGGANLLNEVAEQRGATGSSDWRVYGGHRLWHAPEASPRTYSPDNEPVPFEVDGGKLRLTQAVEPGTGIRKSLELSLIPGRDSLEVVHRLTNTGLWPVELAPWAITVMAPGGVAIVPQEPFRPHPAFADGSEAKGAEPSFLPVRTLALWGFTQLNDPRWTFLDRFILTRQDPSIAVPLKYGVSNTQGWGAYVNNGEMLLKRTPRLAGRYPDRDCNTEVWIDPGILELESLGPVTTVAPGASVEHREVWSYFSGVQVPLEGAALEAELKPMLEDTLGL
jgi:hypothetical protein